MIARVRSSALLQVAGGALVVAGAWLPWLTMFAGLQKYGGLIGWNGRLLLAAGIAISLGGVAGLSGMGRDWSRRLAGFLGVLSAGAGIVLLVRLLATWRDLAAHDAMMVARPGPGLFVLIAGALVAAASLPIAERR